MSVRGISRTWPAGRAPAESQEFHRIGWGPVIDLGCIVSLADPACPGGEFSLMSHDESASLPAVSVEFDVVDARVPCFFGRDPDGNVVNVLSQR